ncbi:hypothetical protein DPEC_G00222510 [Dallia pectoralis]|uniref:Uncharacterized protein n=1 Tax=Dallia pectoralis TaxID=75939 RepID=A0ACC2FZP7_DALPE|nr:hypothetical protein DPEC_G00222510 [Dallia pectoralis]
MCSAALYGRVFLLLWLIQGTIEATVDCQNTASVRCSISLEKLLDRAIQHAEVIYIVSEESLTLFEEMFIPFRVQTPLTRTGNACSSSTFAIPTSRSEVQENSTSLNRYDNAPMALINKTKWLSGKLMSLEQGVTILIEKMLGEGAVRLDQSNESPVDNPVHSNMLESVLRDYTLLACFKKDTHKMDNFLKVLKCRQTGGLTCNSV